MKTIKKIDIIFIFTVVIALSYCAILVSRPTFQLTYTHPKLDFNGYKTVVIITMDDLGGGSDSWNRAVEMLVDKKLPHTIGIITNKADWRYIRPLTNNEYTEIASHSRTHPDKIPYDYEYEIKGSKDDIFENLGVTVVSYILPQGLWNDKLAEALFDYGYTVFRDVRNARLKIKIKGGIWKELYRSELTVEMGDKWGTNNTETLNELFDQAHEENRVYHIMVHPNHVDWSTNSYADQHLSYIANRSDVWYVTMGDFYTHQK